MLLKYCLNLNYNNYIDAVIIEIEKEYFIYRYISVFPKKFFIHTRTCNFLSLLVCSLCNCH